MSTEDCTSCLDIKVALTAFGHQRLLIDCTLVIIQAAIWSRFEIWTELVESPIVSVTMAPIKSKLGLSPYWEVNRPSIISLSRLLGHLDFA